LIGRKASLLLVLAVFASCSGRPKALEPELPFVTKDRLLDRLAQAVSFDVLQFSPDGSEVAYRWKAGDGRQGYAINGRIERYYDEVGEFVSYTRDGTHYAYVAKKEGKESVVFDGTAGPYFDKVVDPDLTVTGRSYAYAAKSGEDAFIIFNERKIQNKDYELITPPDISPDGQRLAYRAQKAGRWHYVIDEKEGPAFDEVEEGYFSGDSRSFAYAARRGTKWVFVRDGHEGPPYDEIGLYPESADEDIYTAKEKNLEFVVFHGKKGLHYVEVGWPRVSPNGGKIAYEAKKGIRSVVVLSEREGKEYDLVGRPVFSADGKHIAYDAVEGQSFLMVLDDKELRDFIAMPNAVFSPKGNRLAYGAVTQGARKSFVVEEGRKGKEYDKVGLLAWSPDGRHLAYAASEGDKAFLVVDGREGKPFDRILSLVPRFSSDGKYVGANAVKGREVWWTVEKVD